MKATKLASDQRPSADRGRVLVMLFIVVSLLGVIASVCLIYIQLLEIKNELVELKHLRDVDGNYMEGREEDYHKHRPQQRPSGVKKRQTSNTFIQELLQAQAHVLESHCANDSRLCMRGPKGEKGDPGLPGQRVTSATPVPRQCACLEEPRIQQMRNLAAKTGNDVDITCHVTGNPQPYVKWTNNGVTVSTNSVLHLTNVDSGTAGNYTCIGQNIVGIKTKTIAINIQ